MCVVCGCAQRGETVSVEAATPQRAGVQDETKARPDVNPHTGDLHFGVGAARVSVPGMSQARAIKLEADILGENKRVAQQNRLHFAAHGVTALNLVSSPGSGKTTLLCATIEALKQRHPALQVSVIEGDQQTSFDADRIRATGAPAIQVNTGKGCHLDAPMVAEAFANLHQHAHQHPHAHPHAHPLQHSHSQPHEHGHDHAHSPTSGAAHSLLFIENVGNLVCPAVWDLGEQAKVAILSVTEGEDKPLKYPDMFAAASVVVLNKVDLLPHLQFDVQRCIQAARQVNPSIEVIQLSATSGAGLDAWLHWLEHAMGLHHGHEQPVHQASSPQLEAQLRQRIAALEAELAARPASIAAS